MSCRIFCLTGQFRGRGSCFDWVAEIVWRPDLESPHRVTPGLAASSSIFHPRSVLSDTINELYCLQTLHVSNFMSIADHGLSVRWASKLLDWHSMRGSRHAVKTASLRSLL